MHPQIYTFKNGLKVVLVDTKSPSLTTLLLVGAGSRYENEKNNGIAHFFEHMAFKGSKKYPSSFVISSTIEGKGGIFNAFTSKDHTGYWIKSTSEHFKTSLDVIADMIQNPLLIEEEINREKRVIAEEINMYEDTPARKIGELFEELLYKNNSLGFDIAGKKERIAKFNKQTFVDYIKSLYHPNNAVLVVAGGLNTVGNDLRVVPNKEKVGHISPTLQKYLDIIKEKFNNWQNDKKASYVKINENQVKPQTLIKYKKTEQAHFSIGFRTFSFNDRRKYILNILSVILGGGMSSRLFIQIRERRGLCYYISTGVESYSDCGNIVTQAGVTKDIEKIKEAIKAILGEHKKITQGDIKKDELVRAKELIKGRLLLSLEDSANVANFFGNRLLLQNKILTPEQIITEIEKVTIRDIINLSNDIFIEKNLNLALIGPFKKEDLRDSIFCL